MASDLLTRKLAFRGLSDEDSEDVDLDDADLDEEEEDEGEEKEEVLMDDGVNPEEDAAGEE